MSSYPVALQPIPGRLVCTKVLLLNFSGFWSPNDSQHIRCGLRKLISTFSGGKEPYKFDEIRVEYFELDGKFGQNESDTSNIKN